MAPMSHRLVQTVFQRVEKKYRLTPAQYTALRQRMDGYLLPDPFGRSRIGSLYYDTPDHRLIRMSMEKPVYKEKLRLRCYGQPGPEDTVYVELKRKNAGVVYKRRVGQTLREAPLYLSGCLCPPQPNQITREIDWFLSFHAPLVPSMLIAYDRLAFYSSDEPTLRITFDSRIVWRENDLTLEGPLTGSPLLPTGAQLMEIKLSAPMPLWLAAALSELRIFPVSFSKYGCAYQAARLLSAGAIPDQPFTAVPPPSFKGGKLYA